MKLTTAFMLALALNVSARGFGQDKISLSVKKTEISSILRTIEKQTSYRFLYNDMLQDIRDKVTIRVTDADLNDVLQTLLERTRLSYQLMDNNLVVIREDAGKKAPDVIIRGVVTGEGNMPLPGASVQIKGTSIGTTTGNDGTFTLNAPDANVTLVISSIGYEPREIAAGGKTELSINLTPASNEMEKVVVVGYGSQRKRDLTGSISSVSGNDIAKMPANNPVSSLQGKVAGLTVVNSGAAGAAPTVRIRGNNSTNSGDPLYVVDGIFQTNIDYLNPSDIESIEILKDPSSLAIFGLQAGNGVIIVTTKRAKKGQTRVNFQSQVGVQVVHKKVDLVDANGFKNLYSQQLSNTGAAPFDFSNYTANTDWQDVVLRNAIMNNNSISISNTGEKTSTYLNVGYNTQEGVLRNDKYQKLMIRLNEEIRVTNGIRIGADVTGFFFKKNNPGADVLNALWAAPIVGGKVDDGLYYSMPSFQRAQVSNPQARLDRFDRTAINDGFRATGSVFAEIKFLKAFTWKSTFYTDLGFNQSRSYTPLPYTFINLGEGAIPTDTTFDVSQRTGVTQSQAQYRNFQQDHTLTFDKVINQDHRLNVVAGFTTLFRGAVDISGNRTDTTLNIPNDPDFWYLNIANRSNPGNYGGGGSEQAFMSYFGRVSYSFRDKYLLNATYRREGNSNYSPSGRWNNFASIGLGWVVTDEDFFKVKNIDFLKLRAAYGTVGNGLGISPNVFRPILNNANAGVFGPNVYPAVVPDYVADPDLKAETTRGIDVGMELRTLSNKLSLDVNFYNRKTVDILSFITLPSTSLRFFTNLGTITNQGIEVSASYNNRIGKDLTYRIGGNLSYNDNNVESIGDGITFQLLGNGGVNRTATGYSIGYFYGYRQIGIYQSTAELDKAPHFSNSLPGDIAYADTNGDGVLDDKDRTFLGTPFPRWNFGGNISLGYKNFDFMIELQGVGGNKIYTQRRTATFATLNYETNRLDAWTGAGTTNIEPILDNTRSNNFLFSSYYLEKGDYLRIRTLQLGYTFGQNAFRKIGAQSLRLFISGQNIATFAYATGYSPEVPLSSPIAGGADNGAYPVPAVYTFGLNLIF
ncbi:TonB-dependent receptor [Terrimonas ferruginea]|uniref:TonB-dependent receptor n=1 Tax=Terrimonas ferruginea TaxID=249 RepID=UPI00048C714E|nr:TonB-dependent receptor [Terrimonas ferruginea]